MASGTWVEVDLIPPKTAEAALDTKVEPLRIIFTALISRRFKSFRETGKTKGGFVMEEAVVGNDNDFDDGLVSMSAGSSIKCMSEQGEEGHNVSGLLTLSTSTLLHTELAPPPPPFGQLVGVERSISLATSYGNVKKIISNEEHSKINE